MGNIKKRYGFTIVELLIVIVVIGILAAISIVAYNGINTQAAEASLKSDLTNASKQLGMIHAEEGNYPSSLPTDAKATKGNQLHYTQTGSGTGYCLTAVSTSSSSAKAYYISNTTGTVAEATTSNNCPGHPTGGSGNSGGSGGGGGTMQAFTPSQCSSLDTYTGSNPNAIITLTDSRGGTTQSYEVAKLADNNCWMLNNLKLGSTSSSITLTPSDSNVGSNFTLPQLTTTGSTNYDDPRAYGPVPGGSNYGYLYNWSAATAGESRTSHPAGAGNAPYSICPSGWRLPTGGATGSGQGEFADLDRAFGGSGMNQSSGPSIAQWGPSGAFKGAFSGNWWEGFYDQGSWGSLWSSSASPGSNRVAFVAVFLADKVYPDGLDRSGGHAVRCLLN